MSHAVSKQYLERLVADFETNPHKMRHAIRDCWISSSPQFIEWALPLVASPTDSQGTLFLLSFLLQNEPLASRLGDQDLCTTDEAILIARKACRIDPTFDRQLAQLLAVNPQWATAKILRFLSVLETVCSPTILLPLLTRMLHHPDEKVRSKAAILTGRGKRNTDWALDQLTGPDARVRANAIEALWGMEGAGPAEVFFTATHDSDPRVAVNGAVGLYMAGRTQSVDLLLALAAHPDHRMRCSACWGMGRTLDPRFLSVLASLIRDPQPGVRSRALRASGIIRSRLKALRKNPVMLYPSQAQILPNGARRLTLALRQQDGCAVPPLHPLCFVLEEDNRIVIRYEIESLSDESAGATGLAIPVSAEINSLAEAPLRQSLRRALAEKPPSESWATVCYSHGSAVGAKLRPLVQTSPEQLERGFEIAEKSHFSGVLSAIEAAVAVLPGNQRSIVVIGNENPESTSIVFHRNARLQSFVAALRNQRITVYALLLPGSTPLFRETMQTLTAETGGELLSTTPQDLEPQLVAMLAAAQPQYSIRYWGFEESTGQCSLCLKVLTPSGYGEARTLLFPLP